MTTTADLRELFLFAQLDEEQLARVAEHADIVEVAAGEDVVTEGEPALCLHVLLSGTIAMSRIIGGDPVETTRTEQLGVYFGACSSTSTTSRPGTIRRRSGRSPTHRCWRCRRGSARWYPTAMHPLEGMLLGMRKTNSQVAERERLLALGKLSAGLTHELNPAAAAGRAADALRDRVTYRVVVGRHHGDVVAESVPGDTRFRVLLPLTEATA